jgi:secernin
MFSILRDEASGICRQGFSVPTGSQVSVLHLPSCKIPCSHWFTATPNPNYSVFKPFIFAPNVTIGQLTISPKYGEEDPVNVKPRFQTKVDRRHYLYKSHENGDYIMRKEKRGKDLHKILSKLEAQCVDDVQDFLLDFDESKLWEIKDLFKDVVESECKFYK